MDRLSSVFFQMGASNADGAGLTRLWRDGNGSLAHDGCFELTDLVTLGQIRVEVVFPIEDGVKVDPSANGQAKTDGHFNRAFI